MKKREFSLEAGRALAESMNIDPRAVNVDAIVGATQNLVAGADRLLELGLRDVEPAFAATPGKEWR